jgi:hypothetical protein
LSSLDKSLTSAYYEVEIDPETQLPVAIRMVILAAVKGETEIDKSKRIVGGKHIAFHFNYKLSEFGKVEKPKIPKDAEKLLSKL